MGEQLKLVSSNKCFEGLQNVYSFFSKELQCETKFSAYIPAGVTKESPAPLMYYLSGLTNSEQDFINEAGFQRYAAEHRIVVIGPDTSPRDCNIPGEEDSFMFGTGAGFYLDATTERFRDHYRMYSYVTKELPRVVDDNLPVIKDLRSMCGHSMGGHGSLVCALKNPGLYKSVSALSPVCSPANSALGRFCFTGYLGEESDLWKEYDSTELVPKYKGPELHLLIDQGLKDEHMADLNPKLLVEAFFKHNISVNIRLHAGYDHGYRFISTFIGDHIKHHANILYSLLKKGQN